MTTERYECIFLKMSDEDAQTLLSYIVSKHKKDNGFRLLKYSVEASGNDGLVVGDASSTWISLSNEREEKISHFLEDSEGIFELELFDISPDGLYECLECLFYQQKEVLEETFVKDIQDLLAQL